MLDEGLRSRSDPYRPLRAYAAIGDGRSTALVADDGAIDWLTLPDIDSPTVFGALLDAERGGRFAIAPDVPFGSERRYLPGTNVLETVVSTDSGTFSITDLLSLPDGELGPQRELQRRLTGLSGKVTLRWRVEPRFDYARARTRIGRRGGVPVAVAGGDAIAVRTWDAGEPRLDEQAISGTLELEAGSSALLALAAAHQEPLVLPTRPELDARFELTKERWRRWSDELAHDGPYREAVVRSALALKLLVFAPSGAVAAAATTSLPEEVGGERNWDYRFCWVRDAAFTLDAFIELGCAPETHAYFWWLMHASQRTHPRLQVLYRLDGGSRAPERELDLSGYLGSSPVRIGNGAVDQLQLDPYGDLLATASLYAEAGNPLDRDFGRRLAESADLVCELWRQPDAGIWEVRSAPVHFTQSKMMCWVALDRALALAERGLVSNAHVERWRHQAAELQRFIETECWSERLDTYVRFAGSEELDASLLLGLLLGYREGVPGRLERTMDAIGRELAQGPFVRRYSGEDGLGGREGAFLACSFWLAEALARCGRVEESASLLEALIELANDVGLYAEEIDPATGAFLGNLPQGLSHLALIRAAAALARAGA